MSPPIPNVRMTTALPGLWVNVVARSRGFTIHASTNTTDRMMPTVDMSRRAAMSDGILPAARRTSGPESHAPTDSSRRTQASRVEKAKVRLPSVKEAIRDHTTSSANTPAPLVRATR